MPVCVPTSYEYGEFAAFNVHFLKDMYRKSVNAGIVGVDITRAVTVAVVTLVAMSATEENRPALVNQKLFELSEKVNPVTIPVFECMQSEYLDQATRMNPLISSYPPISSQRSWTRMWKWICSGSFLQLQASLTDSLDQGAQWRVCCTMRSCGRRTIRPMSRRGRIARYARPPTAP